MRCRATPSYSLAEEAAGGEEGLRGVDDDSADVAVQDRLSLIVKHDSDDEESDDEGDHYLGVATSGLDLALHQPLDWEGLCTFEQMLLTGAVVVGSRANVVDQENVACGHMSAGSSMLRSLKGGLEQQGQALVDGMGFGEAAGVASGIQGPELQAEI